MKAADVDIICGFMAQNPKDKIAAIKHLRSVENLGLKEAKDAIDEFDSYGGTFDADGFRFKWLERPEDRAHALITRMRLLKREMELLVAQFAELADSFDPKPNPLGLSRWGVRVGSIVSANINGRWVHGACVAEVEDDESDGYMPVYVEYGDGHYWLKVDEFQVVTP